MQPTENLTRDKIQRLTSAMWYIRSCGWYATVDTIFFDYDQNWLWMTLIVGRSQQDSFQINPRQWEGLFGDCKQFADGLASIIKDIESIYKR